MPSNTISTVSAPASIWKTGLLVFLAVFFLAIPQAAVLPLIDRDEPRFAEASREMLQSGNFIVPTFNNAPRYAKPPLVYWCQVISFTLFGQNAFAARLPSLVATAGTALILFWWGTRLGGTRVGLIAALSYSFCLQAMQQGRVATADALLIFFMTLSAFTGWKLIDHRSPPRNHTPPRSIFRTGSALRAWTFRLTLAFAAGFLAKGPEAWLPLLPLLILARSWRGRIFFLGWFLVSILFVCLWAIPAYVATHGDYWREGLNEGVGQRIITGLQGHGATTFGGYLISLPLYLVLFWLSALPWSPLLATRGRKLFAEWKLDRTDVYLLLNAGLIFVIFSLMVTKLPHYTLPAFPFLALCFARRWVGVGLDPCWPIKLTAGFGVALALPFLIIALVPWPLVPDVTTSPVGDLVRQGDEDKVLTANTQFALVDFQEPSAVWEMRSVTKGYAQVIPLLQFETFLAQPGPRAVIFTSSLGWSMAMTDYHDNAAYRIFHARGWNSAKGTRVDLTMVVKK